MKILAIESSCDETAAAVISLQLTANSLQQKKAVSREPLAVSILSNVVASQIDIHKKYGGVFPEIASRAHVEKIIAVIQESLQKLEIRNSKLDKKYQISNIKSQISNIDLIAVTSGPGLIGSLLVGVNTAKTLSFANQKPIIPINHWLGHIYSCFAGTIPQFPLLALIVSGGHTGLVYMKSHTDYETIGQTLDDAAGEAFDKVSKILGLGYPGGPAISAAAEKYKIGCHSGPDGNTGSGIQNNKQDWIPDVGVPSDSRMTIKFPRSMLDREDFDFSFSGLKTAVLYKVKELEKSYPLSAIRYQIAYEFQSAVIDILIGKTLKAAEKYQPKSILLCGGVSANKELREQMAQAVKNYCSRWQSRTKNDQNFSAGASKNKVTFHVPLLELCGDNAAMIGIAAAYQIANGIKPTTFNKINADSNLKLG